MDQINTSVSKLNLNLLELNPQGYDQRKHQIVWTKITLQP